MPQPLSCQLPLEVDSGAYAGDKRAPLGSGRGVNPRDKRLKRVEHALRFSVLRHTASR